MKLYGEIIIFLVLSAPASLFGQNNIKSLQTNTVKNGSLQMVNIGLSKESLKEITESLNNLLANEYVLYTKLLNYHWNITGKHFGPLHQLFEDQYLALFKIIDAVAERVTTLGAPALGTLGGFINYTTLSEDKAIPSEKEMIQNLVNNHEAIIKQIRTLVDIAKNGNDEGTISFLGSLLEKHEKMSWMLRAHLS